MSENTVEEIGRGERAAAANLGYLCRGDEQVHEVRHGLHGTRASLTEARDAYQEAMTASTALRNRLDAGYQTLRSLSAELAQVVNDHSDETTLDRKKPELVKGEATRTTSQTTGTWKALPWKRGTQSSDLRCGPLGCECPIAFPSNPEHIVTERKGGRSITTLRLGQSRGKALLQNTL
jgi:hypothetical protein